LTLHDMGLVFGPLWTLAIEEQFYLVWPVVMLLTPRRVFPKVCMALIAASVAARVAFHATDLSHVAWTLTFTRLEGLAAGSLLAVARASAPQTGLKWVRRLEVPALLSVALLFSALMIGFWNPRDSVIATLGTSLVPRRIEILLSPLVGSMLGFVVVGNLVLGGARAPRWLEGRTLRMFGRYSYGAYLLHTPIIAVAYYTKALPAASPVAGLLLPSEILFTLVIITLATAAGAITWHLFEERWLRLAPQYRFSAPEERGEARRYGIGLDAA
jgi:peptidoglycan/LPS O-acetylase OafA/YrhL